MKEQRERERERLIRVIMYGDIGVALILEVIFSRDLWEVIGTWLVINILICGWYLVAIRKAVRENRIPQPWPEQPEARKDLSGRILRLSHLSML